MSSTISRLCGKAIKNEICKILGVTLQCLLQQSLLRGGLRKYLFLFPTLTGIHRNSPMMDHPQDEIKPSLDMFYTASHERFRFLAEFMEAFS